MSKKIEKHRTTSHNVNFVFESISRGDVSIDKFEDIVRSVFSSDIQPQVTQFPDFALLVEPNNSININIQYNGRRVVISDEKITEYNQRNFDNFNKILSKTLDLFESLELRVYGINVNTILDLKEIDSSSLIRDSFLSKEIKEKIESSLTASVESLGIQIVYRTPDGARSEIKLLPRFVGKERGSTSTLIIDQNTHFVSNKVPDLLVLKEQLNTAYSGLEEYTKKILNI
jgi:hypothetical protein